MSPKRITSGLLSLILLVLFGWTFVGGVDDLRIQVMLCIGVVLGTVYTIYGELPKWLIILSGGKIVADEDPSNISPRIYLPILMVAILIAIVALMLVIFEIW
ncbi:hypothetical protein [Gimesia aquarii]|uniref:Uncharacterized protein n=1 Tax=Gimesia aquarii TaxID=2527964 RepID=A0A517W4V7_9PLAN|nr:hypothetical protein [Gimesia aquarii]QDU00288.1 hypothetical protein V144x_58010 [Gimesia aquarii]